jgi:hypothetical protein
VWQEEPLETHVSTSWHPEDKDAWLLISDLPAGRARIKADALRRRVAAMEESRLESRSEWKHRSGTLRSAGIGLGSRHVVGLSSGGFLYPSWRTPSL